MGSRIMIENPMDKAPTRFSQILFVNHPVMPESKMDRLVFPNGWTISIIQGPWTMGGQNGLYEVAFIDAAGQLRDDHGFPGYEGEQAFGHLTEKEVLAACRHAASLPKENLKPTKRKRRRRLIIKDENDIV